MTCYQPKSVFEDLPDEALEMFGKLKEGQICRLTMNREQTAWCWQWPGSLS